MTRNRRAFLAAAGTVAVSGCAAPRAEPAASGEDDPDPPVAPDPPADRDRQRTTVGFGGDTMLGRRLNSIYGGPDGDPTAVWGDLRPRLESLDAVCCNLECCLSTRGEPFPNRAYHFRGNPAWVIPALRAGNVRFTALANNHAMDYGAVSLTDTIDVLEEAGIESAGTGATPDATIEPATFSAGDVSVACVSFSDQGSTYAVTDNRPGIAYVETDPENAETQRIVGEALERARAHDPDLLVASIHWGRNWVEQPGDRLVAFGHWLVDQGVDLVHGHSAHVVQAVEQYGDGVILHDTGDLVDDFGVKGGVRNDRSYLFEVTLEDGRVEQIRLVPIEIYDGVTRASEDAAAWLRETLRARSSFFGTTYERDGDCLLVSL
ncbi:CapA family protein [Natrinema halophilum]|uniref:CapA family protein n=1 Tax=Natrinema halophilum TaxID=1699371 RepID=A0A7D5K746_9EURY|nr:CapA family protein [Natrinema halophilum]QLG49683.1 CapA family protein [Natrinema halophilum]